MNFREKVRFLKRGFRDAFAAYPYPDAIREDQERGRVSRVLQNCEEIAKRRNDILHRPIFGDLHTDNTFQKRRDGQMRQINSQEIIDLEHESPDLCDGVGDLDLWSVASWRSSKSTMYACIDLKSFRSVEPRRLATCPASMVSAVTDRPAATTTAAAPAPSWWSAGPGRYGWVICPDAWWAAKLGRTSTRLDPQAEQRKPPHTSGNGVSAA